MLYPITDNLEKGTGRYTVDTGPCVFTTTTGRDSGNDMETEGAGVHLSITGCSGAPSTEVSNKRKDLHGRKSR